MASSNKNYYVTSPIGSDYEGVTDEAISRGIEFSKRTHRMLSGFGDNENRYDGGSTGFKYLEGTLFSTKDVKFISSDPSMLDTGFIKSIKNKDGCVYNVLRFDRSYNIRSFDFIITYTQLSDWGSKVYKPIPVTRQFRGSLLFTGCSIVRDTSTMEELPLKLYAKYESIGDTVGENVDIDGKLDTRGGPAITLSYTYDSNYIYVYVSSISPFRLIPSGDGEFKDISYLEDTGNFVGEVKPDVQVIKNPETGVKKTESFSRNSVIWCDVNIALRDQTTTHTNADTHPVKFEDKLLEENYKSKESSFILSPTNDGEQRVIGMAPESDVSLELAQDTKPIRFGSRLLSSDMEKVDSYISSLESKIKTASINTEKTPFVIKTSIRTRGKYNIKGEYFIDDQADSFGQILIQSVGTYDVLTDTFDITEYITDKSMLSSKTASTVKSYRKYINNASDYLSEISDGKTYKHVRKTDKILDIIKDINFEAPETLDVYSDIAYIRSPVTFEVIAAFAEFGDNDEINDDDRVIYFCKDGKIRVCGFKDYEMNDVVIYDIFDDYLPSEISNKTYITKVDRALVNNHYVYCFGTNNGIYALVEGIVEGELSVEIKDAFIESTSIGEFSTGEEITYLKSDNEYFYIGGSDGSIRIINIDNLKSDIPVLHFAYGDKIRYAELISEDTILFISQFEACTYNLTSKKWNFEGDDYRLRAKFLNPYGRLENPNIDFIIDKDGWEDVPTIQIGQFVYALGLRSDTSGYSCVYKKLNTYDGSVEDVELPSKKFMTYKPKLCREGNLIYVIGGSCPYDDSATGPDDLRFIISVYDTSTDKWTLNKNVTLIKSGDKRTVVAPNFHPIVKDGKIYVVRPRVTHFETNEITGAYTSAELYDSGIYVIDVSSSDTEFEEKEIALSDKLSSASTINIVPAYINGKNITFLAGLRNVTYDSSKDSYNFNGYDVYRIVYNTEDNSVTESIQALTSNELANNYTGNAATSARTDLFSSFSMYTEYNEAILYALDCSAIIYLRLDVAYGEIHMAYHSLENSTYNPCLTEGEYISWVNSGKTPGKVSFVHVGNYLLFLGGSSDRVDGYLDLSTISWIPAPRYVSREISNNESAILNANSEAISVVSTKDNVVNQVSSCKIDNTIYLLALVKNDSEYSTNLYKYDLSDPTKKIYFVKNLTNLLVSDEYTNGFTNFTLTPLGDDVILFVPYKGYNNSGLYDNPVRLFNVFGYKISTRSTAHIIKDREFESDAAGKIIYALEGENKVIYTVNDGPSMVITLVGENISFELTRNVNYFGKMKSSYTEVDPGCVIPTVRRGKFAIAAVPYKEAILLHEFDTIDGTESERDTSFSYTIDNSADYRNPQLFLNGNDLYLTKGNKSSVVTINGSSVKNISFSTEILKLKFSEAAGLSAGTDNDREHALLSVNTSGMYSPFAISRENEFIVFGEPRVNFKSTNVNNVNVRLIPISSEIKDNTFVDIDTYVTLTGASRSTTNRYAPYMKTIHASGHELVLVFGGHASPESSVTKTLDVYDTARHIWSNICDLPEFISNVSLKDNVIIGGTIEVLKDGTQKAYSNRLEIVCKDYDTLSFEVKETTRPEANYPTYGVWVEEGDVTYVTPVTKDKEPISSKILKIVGDTVTEIDPIDSLVVYNGNYKVVGSFIVNRSLVLVLFNNKTYEISFWKNIIGNWSKVVSKTENNGIDITEKAYSFDISDESYIAISNGEVFNAKAILSYVDPSAVNSKGVLVSYIKVDSEGTITVTSPETFANIPGDDLSNVDSVEVSKDGFTYYSKNNTLNGEVRRIFPNNNSLGFGCRRLEARDMSNKTPANRTVSNNKILTVYEDYSMSEIDLYTDKYTDKGSLSGIDGKIIYGKQISGKLYIVTDTDKFYEINLEDNSVSRTEEIDHQDNYSINIIRDSESESFTLIEGYSKNENDVTLNYVKVTESSFEKKSVNITIDCENFLVINENLDIIYKSDDSDIVYIRSIDGSVSNELSVPTDLKIDRYENNIVYCVDFTGKVFEIVIKDYDFVSEGYTYMTTSFNRCIPNDAIVRNCDIILPNNGYRYIHPSSIDFNHYCYDNIAIEHDINTSYEDKVVSIGVNNEDSNSFVIYTSAKATHLVETRQVVVDSDGKTVKVVIGGNTSMFVDKIDDVLHLYIVNPSNGNIHDINTYTGVANIKTISELKGSGIVNCIKNSSKAHSYVLHLLGNFVIYNTYDDSYDVKQFDIPENYSVKHILKIDEYFKYIRALYSKDDDSFFTYGVFDGAHLNPVSSKVTDIPSTYNIVESETNDSIILKDEEGSCIEIEISDDGSKTSLLRFIPDYFKDVETVNDRPLITFTGNVVEGFTSYNPYKFKFGNIVFRDNDFIVDNNKITSVKIDGVIDNVLKYMNYFIVVLEDKIILVNSKDWSTREITGDNIDYLKSNRTVLISQCGLYYDSLLGISHFAQIISAVDNTDIKLLSFDSDVSMEEIDISEPTLKLAAVDISSTVAKYNIDVSGIAMNTNSNTITFIPKNQSAHTAIFVMSSSYGEPTIQMESAIDCGEDCVIFTVCDKTFIVNRTTWKCTVVCTGVNGSRKTVDGSVKEFDLALSNREKESLKRIASGIYCSSNNRMCETSGKENIYFNPILAVSEYYNRYIGVSKVGKVYDAKVPISEYEISSLGITKLSDTAVTVRAEGNIMAIPYMVHKSSEENVVAHIPMVTRLNTAKFVKDYDTTEDLSTGEIYAFLPSTLNGSLIRDDTSFYRGGNVVSIINSTTVKIEVDDVWYNFSSLDDTLPFKSNILPIVMAYGTRKASDGTDEYRYYSFMDAAGNVSTFDKELKTFVDVDGNVSVKVPFFSSSAMILPSVAKERGSRSVEVWAYTTRNPYSDTSEADKLITSFAKINDDLLK